MFEIRPTGDPYDKRGWDVYEYKVSFDEPTCIFRGDLSPFYDRETVNLLRRLYPGCKIRVCD